MKFLKHVSLYTVAGFFGAGVNFFIMPLLSHYLTPHDYGLIAIFNSYVTILIPFVGLIASSLLTVDYFKVKDKELFASEFTSIQVIPLVPFLFLSLFFFVFYYRINDALELSHTSRIWGLIMMFITLATIYSETFFSFLVVQKKAATYALFNITKVLLEVSITVWFVIFKKWGWEGRLYAWLVTSTLFFIIGIIYFRKEGFLNGKVQWRFMKDGILYGLPLILHTVGKFVMNQSDRLFIAKMISLDKAGIYNIGYTVGSLILIVINAFFNFYTPFLLECLANLDETKKFQVVKMGYFFLVGGIVLLACISFLAPLLFTYLIDKRYETAGQYVFWVGLGYYFWGCSMLFSGFIFYFKRNRILGWLALLNMVCNLIFNYWFISLFGAIGAAYATALSFLIVFIIVALQSNKLIKFPWFQIKKVLLTRL